MEYFEQLIREEVTRLFLATSVEMLKSVLAKERAHAEWLKYDVVD